MNRYIIEENKINGIPLMSVAPEGAKSCPVVFFVHGFTGDKLGGMELGAQLAAAGFMFVSVDAAMHGQRRDSRLDDIFKPQNQVYAGTNLDIYYLLMQIVEETSKDITLLIDYFRSDPRVDSGRLGMCGVSMGGFVTWKVAAENPAIKAAVPIISAPAFSRMWEDDLLEAMAKPEIAENIAGLQGETQRRREYIKSIDPCPRLENIAPKPLLMLNGSDDNVISKLYTLEAYRRLRPLYQAQPDNLQLKVYEGIPHRSTHQMFSAACQWFNRHLGR